MRNPHVSRICGTLLLSSLMSVSVYGQIRTISQAPFTGGVLTSQLTAHSTGILFNGTVMLADGANVVAFRNGTNAQAFRVYSTYTDASNYERLTISAAPGGGNYVITGEAAGTGTERSIRIGGWVVNATGGRPLAPNGDNLYDIGLSANRVRSVYTSGGYTAGIRTVTSNTTLTANDYTVLVDASSGAVTITLPPAASHSGRMYYIKKIDASANNVTIDADSAETIDGAATIVNGTQNRTYLIQSNGTAWYTLGVKV